MKNVVHYQFRLRSSRGTDLLYIIKLRADMTRTEVRKFMEWYADRLVRDTVISQYSVTYRRIKVPSKRVVRRRYQKSTNRLQRARDAHKLAMAMLNQADWTKGY